jgi:hypothetical protein
MISEIQINILRLEFHDKYSFGVYVMINWPT